MKRITMKRPDRFDFWYAVSNTEILLAPRRQLETFGTTVVDYHLVSELMDTVNAVRIREGRLHAARPQIVTPAEFAESLLEGFEEPAAEAYAEWLRQNHQNLMIIRYGFRIRKQESREEIVHDTLDEVIARVREEFQRRDNPLAALVRGVDEPWEVCLIKLMVDLVQRSSPEHARILRQDPTGARHAVEQLFRAAAVDRSRLGELADLLRRERLFEEYQDRFFALVRSHQLRGG
ncbi:MAG: hypothetical protein N2652_06345 [Kiritimatiellae bacterium]|nr:hypothetical protein [Kiritimatiellia bacterium]